ncbi:MAG: endolytic transglycosylase MltG [Chloroflexota bacterium]
MNRSNRGTLIVLVMTLVVAVGICGGLTFLLAGDQLMDGARTLVLRLQLATRQDELETAISNDPTTIRFVVDPGTSALGVGLKLEADGIITDGALFADYASLEGLDAQLDAGTFFINRAMNIKEIASALTTAAFSQITFSIIPGQRIEEVAANIDATAPYFTFSGAEFLAVAGRGAPIPPTFAQQNGIPQGASLEGFLFPDTYLLEPEITAIELRDMLINRFSEAITPELRQVATEDGYTMYDIVTLASIIEREAIFADEHPVISSVYRNRLESPDGWTLDADPTVQYGHPLVGPGNWWPRITRADYRGVISPYNTYINRGLPPGPIASPSFSAIEAAVSPMETPFFFFRADCRGDNRHDFFITYEDHLNAC